MGRTSLSMSALPLPQIKPLDHLDTSIRLPVFTILYNGFRNTRANYMLSAFFVAHFFNEVTGGYVGGKDLAVQMLEELLLNCLI